ncbi:MAG TPA: hypothetical protein PKW95_06880 [bacterium]|nr:hypothetical protein [bacterium]
MTNCSSASRLAASSFDWARRVSSSGVNGGRGASGLVADTQANSNKTTDNNINVR